MEFRRRDEPQVQVQVVGSTGSVVASSREEALAGEGRNISSFGCAWPIKYWMLLQVMGGARSVVPVGTMWRPRPYVCLAVCASCFCSFWSSFLLAK